MIREDLLSAKLSREIWSLGYSGTTYGKQRKISAYCALKWLREDYNIGLLAVPIEYPLKWETCLIYLGEPKEKDGKLDMSWSEDKLGSYKEALLYGIEWGLDIAKEIEKRRGLIK